MPDKNTIISMEEYLRRHVEANSGRGRWEYTRCWKCNDGREPHKCPVKCKGACEYPRATND